MSDILKQTILVNRAAKSSPAETAANADTNTATNPEATVELELVSTQMLQVILESNDEAAKKKIEDVALIDPEGDCVLAHDTDNDAYEMVDADGNDEFSLVSTQMLHRMLKGEDPTEGSEEPPVSDQGFDPYNSD